MPLALRYLNLGKVDGKHEYLLPQSERDQLFYDAFLVPEVVDLERISNRDIFFIEGFRGTGKTSLLRWYAEQRRRAGAFTNFILFKSDLTEQQRMQLSIEVGITWADVDSKRMEVSQDFKSTWSWYIHHKIGEAILADPTLAVGDSVEDYIRLLGLRDAAVYTKILGFLPRLEGAHVRVKSDIPFFELELGGDFKRAGETGQTTLDALSRKLAGAVRKTQFNRPLYIFFDELEVFFQSPEQYTRDQRMIRDLIFSIGVLNDLFREQNMPVHLIAAVRSEVIDNMGALGQEVDRVVHDRGFNIAWHYAKRSKNHPLLEIIKRKITASERSLNFSEAGDPIDRYFPQLINTRLIDAFLLDGSFYKPRDIVWRLTIVQKQFPDEIAFAENSLRQTEIEYSSKLWDEVKYELSAVYSAHEIEVIEATLSGAPIDFTLGGIESRLLDFARHSKIAQQLTQRRSTREILADLFRLGAIGNIIRTGARGEVRNRWRFRGDPTLLAEQPMTLHPALIKRLSAIAPRRRGSRGGARS